MHLRSIDVKMIHPLLTHVSFGMEKVSSEQQLKGNVHYPVKGRRIGSLIYGLVGRYKWFNLDVPVQLLVSLLSLILILIAILAQDLLFVPF